MSESSELYSLRRRIKNLLLADDLWHPDEVLIKRRTNIWNDVAVAVAASKHGQCLVIGVASGKRDSRTLKGADKRLLKMEVQMPITILELPSVSYEQPAAGESDEETRWEKTLMRLEGESLGRSDLHYSLDFESFEDAEDEDYIIRQTVFRTMMIIRPGEPVEVTWEKLGTDWEKI